MNQNLTPHFSDALPPEPRAELFALVMRAIVTEKHRLAKRRLIGFSMLAILSLAAFIPAIGSLQNALIESGTAQFLSLLFSDPGIVLGAWREFSLSILDALPAFSLAAVLVTAVMLLASLKAAVRQTMSFRTLSSNLI